MNDLINYIFLRAFNNELNDIDRLLILSLICNNSKAVKINMFNNKLSNNDLIDILRLNISK
jgi:hypothetical protein